MAKKEKEAKRCLPSLQLFFKFRIRFTKITSPFIFGIVLLENCTYCPIIGTHAYVGVSPLRAGAAKRDKIKKPLISREIELRAEEGKK